MNKNLQAGLAPIVSIVVVVLIILGGVFLSISKDSKDSSSQQNMEEKMGLMDESMTSKATLRTLLEQGKNTSCNISSSSEGITTEGTVYINADGDLRGDFISKTSTDSADSHLIIKDNVAYVWSGGEGVQVKVNTEDGITEQAVNLDLEFVYDCTSWDRDETMLELPAIDFLDLDAMMMEAQQI